MQAFPEVMPWGRDNSKENNRAGLGLKHNYEIVTSRPFKFGLSPLLKWPIMKAQQQENCPFVLKMYVNPTFANKKYRLYVHVYSIIHFCEIFKNRSK